MVLADLQLILQLIQVQDSLHSNSFPLEGPHVQSHKVYLHMHV